MSVLDEVAAVWVEVERLKPWSANPRNNEPAIGKVIQSIKRFGFGAPIVAREQDGEIIAGHTRYAAAIKLGLPKVPVRFLRLDPVEAHLLALADNKTAELSTWDDDALGKLLTDLRAEDADLDLLDGTGFDDDDLKRLLDDDTTSADAGASSDGDGEQRHEASEALRAKWGVEPGQIWIARGQREHRILCGDCRSTADLARLVGGHRINVGFTSPPYASQREYDEASGFKPIPPAEFVDWFEAVQANVKRHLARDGSWFVNIKEHCEDGERVLYVKDLTLAHVRRWGWKFVDELAWVRKAVPGGWNGRFKNGWEPVFHFTMAEAGAGGVKFRPDDVSHPTEHAFDYSPNNSVSNSGSYLLGPERAGGFHDGLARPSNVLKLEARPGEYDSSHPAQFPVGLPEFFIKAYSDAGDIVFDPFLGSGTTVLAAERLDRRGFGTEVSPKYVAVILERLVAAGLKVERADGEVEEAAALLARGATEEGRQLAEGDHVAQ